MVTLSNDLRNGVVRRRLTGFRRGRTMASSRTEVSSMKLRCLLVATLAAACATTRPASPPTSAGATRPLQPGARVVYRYEGSYRPSPVFLEERVLSRDGDRIVIDVSFSSGDEHRHWQMHLTDTPENEAANKIDQLVEIRDGRETVLANENGRDVMRLFEGTYLMPDGRRTGVKTTESTCEVAGRKYPCTVTEATQLVGGAQCAVREEESTAFAWTHVSGEYRRPDGEVLYRVTVAELAP